LIAVVKGMLSAAAETEAISNFRHPFSAEMVSGAVKLHMILASFGASVVLWLRHFSHLVFYNRFS
jgi:hypothetical protein